jgi:hypothetical protein
VRLVPAPLRPALEELPRLLLVQAEGAPALPLPLPAEVVGQEDPAAWEHGRADVWIADYDRLSELARGRLLAHTRAGGAAVVLSAGSCRRDFPLLFAEGGLKNLLELCEGQVNPLDFAATVAKLCGGVLPGLAPYFEAPWAEQRLKVRSSQQLGEAIEEAGAFASAAGAHPRMVAHFETVTDELLTNALYNAPVDQAGQHRYASTSRKVPVELTEQEAPEVTLRFSDGRLGIGVCDPFGTLTPARLLGHLARCFRKSKEQIEQKAGGAGLGLYQVLESLSHLVVNLSPGRRTEMIGLIDIRQPYRRFVGRGKSFNVFISG